MYPLTLKNPQCERRIACRGRGGGGEQILSCTNCLTLEIRLSGGRSRGGGVEGFGGDANIILFQISEIVKMAIMQNISDRESEGEEERERL